NAKSISLEAVERKFLLNTGLECKQTCEVATVNRDFPYLGVSDDARDLGVFCLHRKCLCLNLNAFTHRSDFQATSKLHAGSGVEHHADIDTPLKALLFSCNVVGPGRQVSEHVSTNIVGDAIGHLASGLVGHSHIRARNY